MRSKRASGDAPAPPTITPFFFLTQNQFLDKDLKHEGLFGLLCSKKAGPLEQ